MDQSSEDADESEDVKKTKTHMKLTYKPNKRPVTPNYAEQAIESDK